MPESYPALPRASSDDGSPPTDREIAPWFDCLITRPGQVVELRAPESTVPGRKKTTNISRIFVIGNRPDDLLAFAHEAIRLSARAPGVYFTLNPLREGLKTSKAASDADVAERCLLLIDCDPVRQGVVSSTDQEKSLSFDMAMQIRDFLTARGWPPPVVADSGNGFHLLYLIREPRDDAGLIKGVLEALGDRFDIEACKVDRKVSNASRVCKVYGTITRKGEATPERPHRISRVLEIPEGFAQRPVSHDQLVAMAAEKIVSTPTLDLEAEIERKRQQDETPTNGVAPGKNRPDDVTRASAYLAKCEPAVSGQEGHNKAFKAACKIGPGFDLPPEVTYRLLEQEYNPRCVPPWSEKELRHKVDEAYKVETRRGFLRDATRNGSHHHNGTGKHPTTNGTGRGKDPAPTIAVEPKRFRLTDTGNAERLNERHGRDLHYIHPWSQWLAWDGKRWVKDQLGAVHRLAKDCVRSIYNEAALATSDDERTAIAKWAIGSEARGRRESMIALAQSEPGIPVLPSELDRNPWVLNCLNGTVDLRSGVLGRHFRGDLITQLCPVEYDPAAECPLWTSTLDLVFQGNAGLIDYWQRVCGLALTGIVTEQYLQILHGMGSNGKSTLLNVMLGMFGEDYAMKAPPELLMVKRGESHPTERASLFGKRLVVAIETAEGARINETLVKELTGSDPITARRMREDFWTFNPTHKTWLCSNHRPTVRGTDHAIWRRLRLIPFNTTIPDETAIKDMPLRLEAEYPGILAWCVRGCLAWQRAGRLVAPDAVMVATEGYRQEQDTLANFIAECCVVHDKASIKASALHKAYVNWCEESRISPILSLNPFGQKMEERGFAATHTKTGNFRKGIGLRANEAAENEDPIAWR